MVILRSYCKKDEKYINVEVVLAYIFLIVYLYLEDMMLC